MKYFTLIRAYLQPQVMVIMMLGTASGLPLALSGATFSIYLMEYGIDLQTIGLFSLALLPYTLKFLWAPFVDSIKIPFLCHLMGRRRGWLIFVQMLLAIAIFTIGHVNPREQLSLLTILIIILSFLSATQDIIIDALRIESLNEKDQGLGAAVIVFGYRIGMLISGAGALALAEIYNWQFSYMIMSFCIILAMIVTCCCAEPKIKLTEKKTFTLWLKQAFVKPFMEFIGRDSWLYIVMLIIFYKLSDAYLGTMTNPFLIEIGFSKLEIASVVKTFGLCATLFGGLIGGAILKTIGYYRCLVFGAIIQCLSNLIFIVQVYKGHDILCLMMTIFIENICSAIGTIALVAYIGKLCKREFTATQYALFSSLAFSARSVISSSSGFVAEYVGWINFFIFSAMLSIPVFVLLRIIFNNNKGDTL